MARRRRSRPVTPLPLSVLEADVERLKRSTPAQRARYWQQKAAVFGEQLYRETGQNPVAVAFTWLAFRGVRVTPPAWAMSAVDQIMRELGRLSGNIPKKNRIAHEIARVCGFRLGRKGSTNPFRQFNETLHRIVIAGEVHMALTQTEKLDYAYDLVVREHPARCQKLHGSAGCVRISRRTVMRHYQQYRHTIPSTRKSRR